MKTWLGGVLWSVGFFCSPAFGVAEIPAANVASAVSDAKIAVWGSVLAKSVLRDSSRGNTPDFIPGEFNLGTRVSKGIGSAVGKVWYSPLVSPTALVPRNFWVKQINASLNFPSGIVFGVGRFDSTVKDLHIDAFKAAWIVKGAGTDSADVSFFYGNTFEGSANFGGVSAATQWRAFGLAANSRSSNWIGEAKLGLEPRRLVAIDATTNGAQQWTYCKLGFGKDILMAGLKMYGEYESLSSARAVLKGAGTNVAVVGDTVSSALKMDTQMVGTEFWADTRLLGNSFFFAHEDRFTTGGIVEYRLKSVGEADAFSDLKVLAKGGYHTGQLGAWLELELHGSDKKVYIPSSGHARKVSDLLTLNMEYVF